MVDLLVSYCRQGDNNSSSRIDNNIPIVARLHATGCLVWIRTFFVTTAASAPPASTTTTITTSLLRVLCSGLELFDADTARRLGNNLQEATTMKEREEADHELEAEVIRKVEQRN